MAMDATISPARSKNGGSAKKLIKDQLSLVETKGSNGETKVEIDKIDEILSFDKGFFLTIRAIQLLKQHANGRPILVGIAGPSGAGKTVFCQKIQDFMPGLCVLSMDMYNDASMLLDGNFDDPRLTDYDLLNQNLRDLKAGKTIEAPIYDFKQSKRVGTRTVEVPSSNVIIIEGIYALNDKLRPLQDLRVSISGGVHFDLVKRVMRDITRSGQAPEDIIHQISETVYPMYKAYIEPDLRTAHLRVENSFNPFAGFQSETVVEADKIREVLSKEGYQEGKEMETTDIYLLPPHEDPETCNSWLRMRNTDGHYTLVFEETVCDGDVMISPRIKFEVGVRILGGLMALGYEVGAIMKRRSREWSDEILSVKVDWIEGLDRSFTQIQGKVRAAVEEAGKKLGLEGTYIPHSYIEQVQLEEITEELQTMTMEMKDKFVLAANQLYEPPTLRRNNSGHFRTNSLGEVSGGRGKSRDARTESVTRLQDAVRKRRKDSRSENGWGSGDHDMMTNGASPLLSPPPRPPSRPRSRSGRPLPHVPLTPGANGNNSGGDNSGDNSGGDDGDGRVGVPGHHAVGGTPYVLERYGSPAMASALEGRLNWLSQRVDDLAQAHLRTSSPASPSALNTLLQSQMLLSSKMDAVVNASNRRSDVSRTQLFAAAMGGAAAVLLAVKLMDLTSR